MKAKCPHCKDGCDRCKDGYREVVFAEGEWFTVVCQNREECGFVNGGHCVKEGFPLRSSGKCVNCGGNTDWMLCADAPQEEAWRKPENQSKWEIRRLNRVVDEYRIDVKELRKLGVNLLSADRELTVKEAKLLNICRICKGEFSVPFTYNFGEEYAHSKCLPSKPDGPGSQSIIYQRENND